MNFRLFCLGLGAMFFAGCATVHPPRETAATTSAPAVPVVIDASRQFQIIDGFGASTFGNFEAFERGYFHPATPKGVTYRTTPEQRTAMLTAAVRELGVTHLRFWLPPEYEQPPTQKDHPGARDWSAYNWAGESGKAAGESMRANRDNGIIAWGDFLRTAVPLGLKNWIVTPGVLPEWLHLKFNEHTEDAFESYADWAAAHLLYLKQNSGYEAPYWSLHNEPDALGWFEPEFWHRLIRATGARFRQEGLGTKLMVPDFLNADHAVALMTAVLQSDETRQYIGALAYHHYGTSGDGPQPFLEMTSTPITAEQGPQFERITGASRAMAALGEQYGLPSWQTETAYYPASYSGMGEWEIGRARANEIYYELSSGASAVEGMFLFWPDAVDPRYGTSVRSEGHPIVFVSDGKNLKRWTVTKDTGAVLAHYGRFVRPGDRRISATCNDPMIRTTAFISEKSRRCVVVAINNSEQPKTVALQTERLPWRPLSCEALITTGRKTLEPLPVEHPADAGNVYSLVLPAASVCTIVWSETATDSLELPANILKL